MVNFSKEVYELCDRLGMERTNLVVGDEIVGEGYSTSMGHYLFHGEIVSIQNDNVIVKTICNYYLSGGTFEREEEVKTTIKHLRKSIVERIREHVLFLDEFANGILDHTT